MWEVIRYQNLLATQYAFGPAGKDPLHYYTPPPDSMELVFLIINIIILFALLFTVGILALWQLYYVSQNMTTIESFEISRITSMKNKGQLSEEQAAFPFDLGLFRNFQILFGDWTLFWWLPKKASGNGVDWETNRGSVTEWPPREYFYLKKHPDASFHPKDAQVRKKYGKHVRRGSEGYIVKEITQEQREAMIQKAVEGADLEYSDGKERLLAFDSDFDSLEDTDQEDSRPVAEDHEAQEDSDDDQPLGIRHRQPHTTGAKVE